MIDAGLILLGLIAVVALVASWVDRVRERLDKRARQLTGDYNA